MQKVEDRSILSANGKESVSSITNESLYQYYQKVQLAEDEMDLHIIGDDFRKRSGSCDSSIFLFQRVLREKEMYFLHKRNNEEKKLWKNKN